jgi:hypothetical protein
MVPIIHGTSMKSQPQGIILNPGQPGPATWDARLDELDKIVEEPKRKEKVDGRGKRE